MSLAYCRAAAHRVARSLQRSGISSSTSSPFCKVARHNSQFTAISGSRTFSASVTYPDESMEHSYEQRRLPVTQFTEDEEMIRDAARHWANEELRPLVRDMDNEGRTRPEVIQGLFDHGLMGMVSSNAYVTFCAQNMHCNCTCSLFLLASMHHNDFAHIYT